MSYIIKTHYVSISGANIYKIINSEKKNQENAFFYS